MTAETGLFPSLLRSALKNEPFSMSAGTQIRDFCAVQDVAEAVCLILEEGTLPGRDVFNIGSGQSGLSARHRRFGLPSASDWMLSFVSEKSRCIPMNQ